MADSKEAKRAPKKRLSDRLLENMSRFVVSLTWGILLAVVIAVVYLAAQFAQR